MVIGAVKNKDGQDIFYATIGITISFPVPHHSPSTHYVQGAGDVRKKTPQVLPSTQWPFHTSTHRRAARWIVWVSQVWNIINIPYLKVLKREGKGSLPACWSWWKTLMCWRYRWAAFLLGKRWLLRACQHQQRSGLINHSASVTPASQTGMPVFLPPQPVRSPVSALVAEPGLCFHVDFWKEHGSVWFVTGPM